MKKTTECKLCKFYKEHEIFVLVFWCDFKEGFANVDSKWYCEGYRRKGIPCKKNDMIKFWKR